MVDSTRFKQNKFVPECIISDNFGSWAHSTMSERIPNDILRRIIADNTSFLSNNEISSNLLGKLEIDLRKNAQLINVSEEYCLGSEFWNNYLSSNIKKDPTWLTAPWLFAEFYFYRRVIECFFINGQIFDPFGDQKLAGLRECTVSMKKLIGDICILMNANSTQNVLQYAVYSSLFGNKLDLSLFPADIIGQNVTSNAADNRINASHNKECLLINDIHNVLSYLCCEKSQMKEDSRNISIVLDNAGYELITDFILGYVLLTCQLTSKVVYHTKPYPTFVSDATTNDVIYTVTYMSQLEDTWIQLVGKALLVFIDSGQIEIIDNIQWGLPIPFYDLNIELIPTLSATRCKLVFIKGDANYRRLVGKNWN